jgi:hypothetical protein
VIQEHIKKYWEEFKNYMAELVDKIAEKVWWKINLMSSKEWIGIDKTTMLWQPMKAYHWTNVKFDKFDLWNKIWADNYWRAVYLTEDIKKAELYANRAKTIKWWDKVILDVEIKPWLKLFDQSDKKLYDKLRSEMLNDWVYGDKSKPPFKTQEELDWLKSKWYEWIKSSVTKEIAIFDPNNVKIKTSKPKLLPTNSKQVSKSDVAPVDFNNKSIAYTSDKTWTIYNTWKDFNQMLYEWKWKVTKEIIDINLLPITNKTTNLKNIDRWNKNWKFPPPIISKMWDKYYILDWNHRVEYFRQKWYKKVPIEMITLEQAKKTN